MIDGVLNPGECVDAQSVFVEFSNPMNPPGVVPSHLSIPSGGEEDLSYSIYVVYTPSDLFVAIEVTDDILQDDSPGTPSDDDDFHNDRWGSNRQ